MTDCAVPAITEGMAALLLTDVARIAGTMDARCLLDGPDSAPLPRGMMSCGEAARLTGALTILLLEKFPALAEESEFAGALNLVRMEFTEGDPN